MEETQTTSVFDELNQEAQYENASQGQRFVNQLIDAVIFYVIFFAVVIVEGKTSPDEDLSQTIQDNLTIYIIIVLYYWLMEAFTKGRTVGKYVTKTMAVNEDTSEMNMKTVFIRSLCRLIPFEPLSALGNRPWHDRISKTNVVKIKKHIF